MPKLKFRDLKAKKTFETDKFEVISKKNKKGNMMKFAVTTAPSGAKAFRIVSKDFKK